MPLKCTCVVGRGPGADTMKSMFLLVLRIVCARFANYLLVESPLARTSSFMKHLIRSGKHNNPV